jgi:release factor glutamine methyltransferase
LRPDPRIYIEECPGVYPPSEDTLLLLDCLGDVRGRSVLEMGCGTGIIALHCAAAGAEVMAVDVNPRAVACARANAERNGMSLRVLLSDLFQEVQGKFEVIVFNPPYLPGEALDDIDRSWAGGRDGVAVLARFLSAAREHLSPGGSIYLLLSSLMDEEALQRALAGYRWQELGSRKCFFEVLSAARLWPESSDEGLPG